MPPELVDSCGQSWRWLGQLINVSATTEYPSNIRGVILAFRDASTPEEEDLAAYLVWSTEEHPPWSLQVSDVGCATCRTTRWCPEQDRAHELATQFLITKSTQLIDRIRKAALRKAPA